MTAIICFRLKKISYQRFSVWLWKVLLWFSYVQEWRLRNKSSILVLLFVLNMQDRSHGFSGNTSNNVLRKEDRITPTAVSLFMCYWVSQISIKKNRSWSFDCCLGILEYGPELNLVSWDFHAFKDNWYRKRLLPCIPGRISISSVPLFCMNKYLSAERKDLILRSDTDRFLQNQF